MTRPKWCIVQLIQQYKFSVNVKGDISMSKKIKIKMLLLATFLMSTLVGCGYKETLTVYSDGSVDCEMFAYESVEDVKSTGSIGKETINGKVYYKFPTTKVYDSENDVTQFSYVYYTTDGIKTTTSVKGVDCGDKGTTITSSKFIWNIQNSTGKNPMNFYTLTVTMPKAIKKTNGTLSADKKTVTFDLTSEENSKKCYAYTTVSSDNSIALTGLNSYGHITKAKTLKVKTSDTIKSIKVNGKSQTSKNIKVKTQGKYKVVVKTANNSKTFTFYFDKTKPTLSVKNKEYSGSVKITFKDKHSGIKSAKLDGESIKSGYVCKDSGKHTLIVKDKAGNTKKVIFKIK